MGSFVSQKKGFVATHCIPSARRDDQSKDITNKSKAMRTHQRFIATAAIVGAALLSPAPVCAERTVRAASSLVEREEFGGAAVPEDTANIVALREPAGADVNMEEFSGRRRLMWWNWIAGHRKSPLRLARFPMVAMIFSCFGWNPVRNRVFARRPVFFVTQIIEIFAFRDIILTSPNSRSTFSCTCSPQAWLPPSS